MLMCVVVNQKNESITTYVHIFYICQYNILYASIPGTVNELIYTVYHINIYADTTNKFFISIIL